MLSIKNKRHEKSLTVFRVATINRKIKFYINGGNFGWGEYISLIYL